MKILVDEMPLSGLDCPFGKFSGCCVFNWKEECELDEENVIECSYVTTLYKLKEDK